VEISPSLCKRIDQKLTKAYPHLVKNKQVRILNQDISDYKESEPCFTLFFEVLDNMPHDKVLWNAANSTYDRFVTADVENNQEGSEDIQADALIQECLELYQQIDRSQDRAPSFMDRVAQIIVDRMARKSVKASRDVFLPTFMLRLLKRMSKNMPQSHLLISDFDHLVTSVPGINAPIVSSKGFKSEEKKDYDNYLVQRG
jgi:hypothetical protein